ncbi:MAG TPA: metalloregulator ArsR/SmtB family transcription factor [Polyangiales bacterium]|nr:metalloregulator ArsR/SmtB family transcription factor [Polyangiales bacterium]
MSRASAARSLRAAAPLFAALGDETRLHLVSRLCQEGPLSITQLSEGVPVTRQAITKHLTTLADAGVVRDARSGRERIWQLEPRSISEAQQRLAAISAQWDAAIERLRRFVEED